MKLKLENYIKYLTENEMEGLAEYWNKEIQDCRTEADFIDIYNRCQRLSSFKDFEDGL